MNAASSPPLLLLLGGSFNPPHAGHLRIAIETAEVLRPERTLFIPCAYPPHKPDGNLLPFAVRAAMLRAAIADMTSLDGTPPLQFAVSEVEQERQGPSYTADTLAILKERFPGMRPAFVMGNEDYAQLSSWRRWRELPVLADLVVLPRSAGALESFRNSTLAFWPDASPLAPPAPGVTEAFLLPHGGRILYLPQPQLDISSSLVRERLLAGRSLDFLVPPGVRNLLMEHAAEAVSLWRKEPNATMDMTE